MLGFSPLSSAALSAIAAGEIVPANATVTARALITASGTRQASANAAILGKAVVTALYGPIQGNAAITGRAIVTAKESTVNAIANVYGRSIVTALGGYSRAGVASVLGKATVTANGARLLGGNASVICVTTFTAAANNVVLGGGAFNGRATVAVNGHITAVGVASMSSRAVVDTEGMIYGEEWTKVTSQGDTWLRPRISFGEWTPDQPGISGGVTEAVNCYPVASGYAPIPNIEPYPNEETQASETLLTCFGGKFGGQNNLFAASASKIYKFDSGNNNFSDVSKSGGYSATTWDITQFGPVMILANGISKLQSFDLSGSSLFADLSADAPISKYVTVVRDFVVAANAAGAESTVYWWDINNETNWTASSSSQADAQVLPEGGDITGLAGGEYGLIFLERAIYRMTYAGSPFFFQFDAISRSIGCISNNAIGQLSGVTYFLADDGFYSCNGQSVAPIGNEKINRWFFENVAIDKVATEMSVAVDPVRALVIWVMPTAKGKQLLIYSAKLNRWSYSTINVSAIAYVLTSSATLEQLDKVSITPGTNTLAATYTRTDTTVTVTATNHGLQTNGFVYFDATSGGAADGFYQITRVNDNSFTFTTTASGTITTSNCTLSLPSIDALTASFDDRAYAGGTWFLAGVSGQKVYAFTGDFADAYVSSADIDIGRSLITLAKPIVDNGSGDVAVSSRVLMTDVPQFGDYYSPDSINRVSLRSSGNYHRLRVKPTGVAWRTIVGLDVEIVKTGDR